MTIIRWDPMSSLLRWPSILDEDGLGFATAGDNLDVYEDQDNVVVKANVAGVDPDKVEITFEKGVLTLSATQEGEESSNKKYYKRASRSYTYRVAVPGHIDLAKEPEASVKNGIVSVVFKKAEESKPKKISIKK